jgi:exodeoxyribonuclease-3
MQETKVEDALFPVDAFEEIGYRVVFRGAKRYNGVAIASLDEAEEVSFGLDDGQSPDEDRLVRVTCSGVSVVNTYIPQGNSKESPHFSYKLAWFDRLRGYFERHYEHDDKVIWCGDLNVAREHIDVHDPKRLRGHVCFTPEVWDGFDAVKAWGFHDVFRHHHPEESGHYTFFDYRVRGAVDRGLGWRVDHILASATMVDTSIECSIDMATRLAEKPSDHTVLVATFNL